MNKLQKIIHLIDTKYKEYLDRPINFPNADLYLIIQNIDYIFLKKYVLYLLKKIIVLD